MTLTRGPEDRTTISRLVRRAEGELLGLLERLTLPLDRRHIRRTRSLDFVPGFRERRGGKASYGEWCWLVGLLEGELARELTDIESPSVVDLGCGSGLVAAAASSTVRRGGTYCGLDVQPDVIEFCRRNYPDEFRFEVLEQQNAHYRPQGASLVQWPVSTSSTDLVTAVSVWTHLTETDAQFALSEAARITRPGGRLLFSAFVKAVGATDIADSNALSRFHRTESAVWQFDVALGNGWWTTAWANPPERAIAIDEEALRAALADVGFEVESIRSGTWHDAPGLYFQDIVSAVRT